MVIPPRHPSTVSPNHTVQTLMVLKPYYEPSARAIGTDSRVVGQFQAQAPLEAVLRKLGQQVGHVKK